MANKIWYNQDKSRWELIRSDGAVYDYAVGASSDNPALLQWSKITLSTDKSTGGTAIPADILEGDTAISRGTLVVGTMPYHAPIIHTPTYSDVTYPAGYYDSITIRGDYDLIPDNIKEGVNLFGVVGTHRGGVDTSDATASSYVILEGYTAYVDGNKVVGSIPIASQAAVENNVVTIPYGMVKSEYTISVGTMVPATTYIPGTADQTIDKDIYTTGVQTIKGDVNLIADNIRKGVEIFGISGKFAGDIIKTTATSGDIMEGKTAVLNGILTVGSYVVPEVEIPEEYADVSSVTATASTVLEGYSFVSSNKDTVTGTIPDNGAVIIELTDDVQILGPGYYRSIEIPAKPATPGTDVYNESRYLLVSGAGSSDVNGVYELQSGNISDRTAKFKHISRDFYIFHMDPVQYPNDPWVIYTKATVGGSPWTHTYYSGTGDLLTTNWLAGTGISPVPSVSLLYVKGN